METHRIKPGVTFVFKFVIFGIIITGLGDPNCVVTNVTNSHIAGVSSFAAVKHSKADGMSEARARSMSHTKHDCCWWDNGRAVSFTPVTGPLRGDPFDFYGEGWMKLKRKKNHPHSKRGFLL
jgi:hypothetical protein